MKTITISITVPDGVEVAVVNGSAAASSAVGPSAGAGQGTPGSCPIHHEAWRGEPGDLYHKKAEGGYCRHPDNTAHPVRR